MINSKDDLKYYLKLDREALKIGGERKYPRIFMEHVWRYQIFLRKLEYCINTKQPKFIILYYKLRHNELGRKLGFQIPPNVIDAGLRINHFGLIVISSKAKIGKYCDLHQGINVGVGLDLLAPQIGDDCWIGPGAKLYGDIKIGNNVMIGANAVVTKSFEEDAITIAGVPAKIISYKGKPLPKDRIN